MQQRRGTASQWVSSNDGDGPTLNAGEIGFETDTNKFKIGDGVSNWSNLDYFSDVNSTVNPAFGTSIVFEGATADSFETTLQVTDPTADRTITLPNATGTVITTGNLSDITDIGVFTSTIVMEGSTADSYELTLSAGDPTADRTITFPDASGTVALAEDVNTSLGSYIESADIGAISGVAGLDSSKNLLVPGTKIIFEGTDNAHETEFVVTDPTADVTITFPDATGTVQLRVTDVSDTEIGYLNGVTSAIQTQIGSKLDLSGGTMTGAIAMGTNKITGLGTPTDSTDAATKAYVDAVTEGLHIHASVVAATTANVTLASALENGDTLDGITLATNDRILVKNQTTTSENGIYVVQASGQPSRATDFDTAAEVDSGDFVFVAGGTVNGSTGWVQTNKPATIGTDPILFTQFAGAGTYTAGNGLTLTGSVFSIDTTITQARVADVSDTEIGYLNGVTSAIQTQLNDKSPLASPTFTGTVTIPNGAALGTPASATLTNATGLPVGTGISGLGSGVATFLATPSSANFASMISDEIGTGNVLLSDMATSAQSASYTLVLADKAKVVEMSVGSANNLTVPLNSSVAFPTGTQIHIVQTGSGQTTVVATGGVTINTATTLKLRAQWSAATLIKRAENTWVLVGDLATS
jgi:hypothetical protein